jgi:hypothetical protein
MVQISSKVSPFWQEKIWPQGFKLNNLDTSTPDNVSCQISLAPIFSFSENSFYATAASGMWWHIAIYLCVCVCVRACVCACVCEFKKSSSWKPLVWFQPNLPGLFLGRRSSTVVQRIWFHLRNWVAVATIRNNH